MVNSAKSVASAEFNSLLAAVAGADAVIDLKLEHLLTCRGRPFADRPSLSCASATLSVITSRAVCDYIGTLNRGLLDSEPVVLPPDPETDVVMMGHILHDWNLQEKRMLIRKA